jgi:hypothetical protein
MSYRDGDVFLMVDEQPAACELCGRVAHLRPYGPNGENICHPCGQKDPEGTNRAIIRAMSGAKLVVRIGLNE